MTIKLISYASGDVTIATSAGVLADVSRERAFRLVMHARMHDVEDFVAALPALLAEPEAAATLAAHVAALATSSERWAFKESFARLHTLSRSSPAGSAAEPLSTVEL